MGRIVHQVNIESALQSKEVLELDALVNTGASLLTLPMHYKEYFQSLIYEEAECVTASEITTTTIGGPVKITLHGYRSVFGEIAFLKGLDEPLIGYSILEIIPVAVDMLGHRLVPVKYLDMK